MAAPLSQADGRTLIEAELRPGEQVLWVGTPDPWDIQPAFVVLAITFGVVFLLSAAVLADAALSVPGWLDPAWGPLLLVLAVPLLAAGLACFHRLVREHRHAARRAHAITGSRLLTVTSLDAPQIASRDIGSIVRMTRRERREGRGTLRFDPCGKSSDGEGGYTNEIETWRSIPAARDAEAAFRQAQQRSSGAFDVTAHHDGPRGELASLFGSTLEAGETLRWAALRTIQRPSLTDSGVAWRTFLAALVLAIIYGFSAASGPIQRPIAVAAVLFGSLLTLGVVLVIRKHRAQLRAETAHAVTDRRLIRITRGSPLRVSSIRLDQVKRLQRFDSPSGPGTLTIDYADGIHQERWIKETETWLGIDDARGAESAILAHWLAR